MRLSPIIALPLLLAASAASADMFTCDNKSPRRLTANVGGATRIVVIAKSGSLRVSGRAAADVGVSATACASDKDFLSEMNVVARRDGTDLVIEALIPERVAIFGWSDARLDMEVGVPANLPVVVRDGAGEAKIENVASLEVVDGSGELAIRNVRGDVEIVDGSGEVSVRDVGGNVTIRDGSGSMEIEHIGGSVLVRLDGSGSIDVVDVKGDFTVDRDGSGGIDHERVGGKVRIPRD